MLSKRSILHKYAIDELLKAGCTVDEVDSNLIYVKYYIFPKFDSETKFKLKYSYHRDNHGKFFLERIKPFNIPIGEFMDEEELARQIIIDIDLYRNAVNSSNFNNFIELGNKIDLYKKTIESLFLYKNVEHGDLIYIKDELQITIDKIVKLMENRQEIGIKK